MSTLYISEFSDLPLTSNGVIQAAAAQNWLNDQTVAISGTSTPSNPFNAQTAYVLLSADVVCSIAWTPEDAATVSATTGSLRIPANMLRTFGVSGGMKVSAITNS